MPIAVTEEHEDLRRTAQRWLETHCPPTVPRAAAEAPTTPDSPPPSDELPALWERLAAQGWLGLHVPEHAGGQGFTLAEVAVVLEELGHALFPGPLLSTLLVSAALVRRTSAVAGSTGAAAATAAARRLLPGLADGSVTAAVALGATPLEELFILYRRIAARLRDAKLQIVQPLIGHWATSMEMAGVSLSLLFLDDELERLLAAPADCPFWRV